MRKFKLTRIEDDWFCLELNGVTMHGTADSLCDELEDSGVNMWDFAIELDKAQHMKELQ